MDLWPSRAEVACAIARQGFHGFSSLSVALPAPLKHSEGKGYLKGGIGCETTASLSRSPGPPLACSETKFLTLPWVNMLFHGHGCAGLDGHGGMCVCVT